MINASVRVDGFDFGHIGWKYYNTILKKAMEQEFSWSGLLISLSIAFFIVIACAQGLNMAYQTLSRAEDEKRTAEKMRLYQLERDEIRNAVYGVPAIRIS